LSTCLKSPCIDSSCLINLLYSCACKAFINSLRDILVRFFFSLLMKKS
jgi:hypothetical protein